ncbi:type I polyketide synthase [Brevibacillus brevis]|uniref:type I polyketide synthase n=1 Tax=Brevibacillus brevis TaxID=1393 RepID=UPI000D104D0C|nr:type I polyketide synthase [Brevibacillus brevis]PSJ63215.1 hypothetical protein C7J99_31550 [Brevibacillus brevis]RED35852.1 acyl transferase domain-containing protein [Brevibacillus brevis]GEC93048.1 hypothetical protein BBR01nite_53790 [Brevibacillus brevis]VEF89039.1 Polyketide synthase PksN [Brevibacillus brevis]
MSNVTQYVIEKTASGNIDKTIGVEILKRLKLEEKAGERDEVAVVGLSIQLPHADELAQFWSHLQQGIDCVAPFPAVRRKDTDPLLTHIQAGQEEPDYARGSYLSEVDKFDAAFFQISPVEARLMDPQQRLFLQTAWKVLEDAGYGGRRLSSTRTGVYVGYTGDFSEAYKDMIANQSPEQLPLSVPGNISSIIASRIAYLLDLHGPALLVDTACSSSLVALHLAVQGLRNGDCDNALVGGVKLNLLPLRVRQEGLDIVSTSAKARTFDDDADGTGFGEGVIAMLLKPLPSALRDGDRIYAVIKGSAINQDGSSIGITAPSAAAQEDVIIRAWQDAQVNPETIGLIEAHGTGTKLGDPIEMEGLTRAFNRFTQRKQFCAIGSVKSNVGHLDHLAGLAGVVKAIAAMQYGQLPPTLHFQKPNRNISFPSTALYVNDRCTPWERHGMPRRCGVSSFGLSGTNCHVVLEEAPPIEMDGQSADRSGPYVLPISAKSQEALRELTQRYHRLLVCETNLNLFDLCATASVGRGHYTTRLALLFNNHVELRNQLATLVYSQQLISDPQRGIYWGEHRIIPEQKGVLAQGELTEERKRQLSVEARTLLGKADCLEGWIHLYVSGADVDWTAWYGGQPYRKVALPLYPFAKKRYWVENANRVTLSQPAGPRISFLIDRILADTMHLRVYGSQFGFDTHWMLSEHLINGQGVVPGTTYLEMIRQLSLLLAPGQSSELEGVIFLAPLIVGAGESREVHVMLKEEIEPISFTIVSRGDTAEQWIKHCEGRLSFSERKAPPLDVGELAARFTGKMQIHQEEQHQGAIEFGPRWHNIDLIRAMEGEVLVDLRLHDDYAPDLTEFVLHPALFDNAMNIAINHVGDGMYLPWTYKKLRVYAPIPQAFTSWVVLKSPLQAHAETATFDAVLFDSEGQVVAEAEDYVVKKVRPEGVTYQGLQVNEMFRMEWKQEFRNEQKVTYTGGLLLLLRDAHAAEPFLRMAKQEERAVVRVNLKGTDRETELTELLGSLREASISQIVYFLDGETPEDLFGLAKALSANRWNHPLELTLLGTNANRITGEEGELQPLTAAAFALGKVIHEEFEHLRVRCIDRDRSTDDVILWKELVNEPSSYIVGYRAGTRWTPQLSMFDLQAQPDVPFALKTDGVYLITGGIGGLGLEVGRHWANVPNVKLAFLSRSTFPPREEWTSWMDRGDTPPKITRAIRALIEMEQMGAEVCVCKADISVEAEIGPVLRGLRERYGRIRGIVHAAGVAGDGFLFHKKRETFCHVLTPKVSGTILLDRLTAEDELDFFVFFSSISALTGGVGQGDYAAANAFLDAYAAFRNSQGKRTLAINWPAWKETGMAVDYGVEDRGFLQSIRTATALQVLDQLLSKNVVQVLVGKLNDAVLGSVQDNDYLLPLSPDLRRLISRRVAQMVGRSISADKVVRPSEAVAIRGYGDQGLSETEIRLAKIWAGVLELDEIDVYDSFHDMGGDSILAASMLRALEAEFGSLIDISDIFTYSSVYEMAAYLEKKQGKVSAPASEHPEAVEEAEDDDEIERVLRKLASGELDSKEADKLLRWEDEEDEWD